MQMGADLSDYSVQPARLPVSRRPFGESRQDECTRGEVADPRSRPPFQVGDRSFSLLDVCHGALS